MMSVVEHEITFLLTLSKMCLYPQRLYFTDFLATTDDDNVGGHKILIVTLALLPIKVPAPTWPVAVTSRHSVLSLQVSMIPLKWQSISLVAPTTTFHGHQNTAIPEFLQGISAPFTDTLPNASVREVYMGHTCCILCNTPISLHFS